MHYSEHMLIKNSNFLKQKIWPVLLEADQPAKFLFELAYLLKSLIDPADLK